MRVQWLAAIVVLTLGAGAWQAQPAQPPKPPKAAVDQPAGRPAVEVRVRSVNDLLDKTDFLARIVGQENQVTAAKLFLRVMIREKTGLEGVNPKLPFGLYGDLSPDLVNSPIILMIPIADQDRFLKLLNDRLEIVPEKAEEGTLKAHVPIVEELYLRFANGYLYVGRSVKDLDPKKLADPKTFFAAEDPAVASVVFRMNKLPAETKKFIFGQFELTVKERRKGNGANEDPAEKLFLDWFGDALSDGVDTLFRDAEDLRARVLVDEKTQELSVEASLSAKPGSAMARNFASLRAQPSVAAAIVASKAPVLQVSAKAGLPAEVKKRFAVMIDDVAKELENKADPNAKEVVRQIIDALAPTFKAAELDTAVSLRGPNAKGHHTLVVASGVKKGKDIEKLLKELALSAGGVADFDFDFEKIGDFNLHKITLSQGPPELTEIFGTLTFWVAISDSCFALSLEPDGAAIRSGLKAKAEPVPAFSLDVSAARLLPLLARDLKPDEVKALLKDTFGEADPAGKDKVSVSVTGGDQLTFKTVIKGKAAQLFISMGKLRQ